MAGRSKFTMSTSTWIGRGLLRQTRCPSRNEASGGVSMRARHPALFLISAITSLTVATLDGQTPGDGRRDTRSGPYRGRFRDAADAVGRSRPSGDVEQRVDGDAHARAASATNSAD